MQKKYSVDDIEEMRQAIAEIVDNRNWLRYLDSNGFVKGIPDAERNEQIERELLTHMRNGTDAADLIEKAACLNAAVQERIDRENAPKGQCQ